MNAPLPRLARTFTIRQLCKEFEVTPRSLRFYEDKGLLNPSRNGMNRVYAPRDRARLQLILRGKRVGFSLAEIREMLDLYDKDETHAAQMAISVSKFRKRIAELQTQRIDIDLAIEGLKTTCTALEARLARVSPDLLPCAEDYDKVLRARIDGETSVHPA
jgi:DNA-binding transcriptional MerR regulator